jgi:hypothetical protein
MGYGNTRTHREIIYIEEISVYALLLHAREFVKFVSIRKEAILSVPYEVYSMSSMFHSKKIRKLHVQKICENGPGKNPRDTGTSLAAKRA